MKIVIDKVIPFLEGVFEPYADVLFLDTRQITRDVVADADALVIRTRTRCDASLLEGSSVKIIATASIGTHHIDFDYCSARGIFVCNASGSNSGAIMNYVFSALYGIAARRSINMDGFTIGLVGAGASGTRVAQMAHFLGFRVLKCDPPQEAQYGPDGYCSLDTLLSESNVVSLHLPLYRNTYHMADESFFSRMRPGAFFINASAGDLVDEEALVRAVPKLGPVIIDAWCNEPYINKELMDMTAIATPHIASYTHQGKQASASIVVRSVARFLGFEPLYDFYPKASAKELEAIKLDLRGKTQGQIASVLQYNYPIFTDDFMFRLAPDDFISLREHYNYRREFYVDY